LNAVVFNKPDQIGFREINGSFVEIMNKWVRVQGDVVVHGLNTVCINEMQTKIRIFYNFEGFLNQ
jgi:hypothetical protein